MDHSRDIKNPYSVLIEDMIKLMAGLTEQQVRDAVLIFQDLIDSKRVVSYIKDISGLITVLEARNTLHSQNVEDLLTISKAVDCPLAIKMIENYKKYKEPIKRSEPSRVSIESPVKNPIVEQTEKVFSEVARLLWKDVRTFARALNFGLTESELNHIMIHSPDENDAALKILKMFREKEPNADHVNRVVIALSFEGARRADILRKINCIISPVLN